MLGADQILWSITSPYRLAYAQKKSAGIIPINFDEDDDPADTIIRQTKGMRGVDGVVDAVGFEAKGSTTETVLATLKLEGQQRQGFTSVHRCRSTRRHRQCSWRLFGVHPRLPVGDAFDKGLTFKIGQTHVHRFLPELLDHIETGRLSPEVIISHRMSLEQAAEGYKIFDKKEEDCRKVILTPGDSPHRYSAGR